MTPTAFAASLLILLLAELHLQPAAARPRPPHSASAESEALQFTQPSSCPVQRILQVKIDGGAEANSIVTLHLIESSLDFLHSSERVLGVGGRQFEPSQLTPCFYQGSVEGDGGLVVAKQRNGVISGNFHYAGRVFELPEQPAAAGTPEPLRARRLPPSQKATCGVSGRPVASSPLTDAEHMRSHQHPMMEHELHERSRRSLKLDTYSSYNDTSRKYIQLILVGDQALYKSQKSDKIQTQDRLWEVGNYVNALYKQLGVNVIIVYTEVWTADPYTLNSADTGPTGTNSTVLLNLFMNYRMQSLASKIHSAAHLVSGLKFRGTDVGLANMAQLCSFSHGGGVNSDQDANAYGVAATVAHELGHNLGLNHDDEEKNCPACLDSQGCVMAAVGADPDPVRFSGCSIKRYLDFSVANGLGYCMSDPPADSATVGTKVTCGNRIVEAGEDCDCGPDKWCSNRCCNPSTCRFATGALCASGECCNLDTCSLKSQGVVCRAERSVCDLPEFCNGSSEWCPLFDDYKVDGTECLTGKAYCYKGRCNDRDSRCVALYKGPGFSSAQASWSVAATKGTFSGYCSYKETSLNPLKYSYTACSAANQRCGLLYCVGGNLAGGEPMPRWKGIDMFNVRVLDTTIGEDAILAAYAMHNIRTTGYRDPGMVPNGAECGTNMMCVDSQCITTTSSVTCPNCNSRGSCTQSGLCFCQSGYRPPDCLQVGGGGSLTNRLPDTVTPSIITTSAIGTVEPGVGKSASRCAGGWNLSGAQLLQLLGCIILMMTRMLGANWQ